MLAAGTPIRDYIHVVDVAQGHISAVNWINAQLAKGGEAAKICEAFNFGTGKGTTVLELVASMEKASGMKIPVEVGPRRLGDLPESYCDPTKAREVLGWEAKLDLDRICVDAWRFQKANPNGYEEGTK